jgi:hypothetical protein
VANREIPVTRQEFTDAVAEVLGLHPGVEVQIDTIVRLADMYKITPQPAPRVPGPRSETP